MLMPVEATKAPLLPVTEAPLYILREIKCMSVQQNSPDAHIRVDLVNLKAGQDKLTHTICDTESVFGSARTLFILSDGESAVNRGSDP